MDVKDRKQGELLDAKNNVKVDVNIFLKDFMMYW